MNLQQAIDALDQLGEDLVICAKKPWGPESDCQLILADEDMKVPASIIAAGYDYFLEVHIIKEIFQVFGEKEPTLEEKVRLSLFYAKNDAYPDWVYV